MRVCVICVCVCVCATVRECVCVCMSVCVRALCECIARAPQSHPRCVCVFQEFQPQFFWWRCLLLGRKVLFLVVSKFAADNAMFQTSAGLAILMVSYGLQAAYRPFVSSKSVHEVRLASYAAPEGRVQSGEWGTAPPLAAPAAAVPAAARPRGLRRSSVAVLAAAAVRTAEHLTDFNVLESVLLVACIGVLLGGAIFQSAVFREGDAVHWIVTVIVSGILATTLGLFAWMLGAEVRPARAFAFPFADATPRAQVRRSFRDAAALAAREKLSDTREMKRTGTFERARAESASRSGHGSGAALVHRSPPPSGPAAVDSNFAVRNPMAVRAAGSRGGAPASLRPFGGGTPPALEGMPPVVAEPRSMPLPARCVECP